MKKTLTILLALALLAGTVCAEEMIELIEITEEEPVFEAEEEQGEAPSEEPETSAAKEAFALIAGRDTLAVGETLKLEPIGAPEGVTVTYASSDTRLATVKADGTFKAVRAGEVTVTATAGEQTAELTFTIVAAPTKVALTGLSEMGVGETAQLNVALNNGGIGTYTLKSSNTRVLNVSDDGQLIAVGAGKATITARSYNGKTAKLTVKVSAAPISLRFDHETLTVAAGDAAKLTPVMDGGGSVTLTSEDPEIAEIGADGKITAKNTGAVLITAKTYNGLTATCEVTVTSAPDSVTVAPEREDVAAGESIRMTAAFAPADCVNATLTWAVSDKKLTTITQDGTLKILKAGTFTVTATAYNGVTSTATVTAVSAPGKVTVSGPNTMGAGETAALSVTLNNGGIGTYTFRSSNEKVLSVSADGKVTAVAKGKATVTVRTYNGKTAKLTVTVSAEPTSVTLSASAITVAAGDEASLTAKADANGAITLTSDAPDIAQILADGRIIAKQPGTATITATTYNQKTASCTVTVTNAPESLTLSGRDTLATGETETLSLGFEPADCVNASVKWTTSNAKVVSVAAGGTIKALKAGTATVTAETYNGKSATMEITVAAAPSKVTLALADGAIGEKQTAAVTVTLNNGGIGTYTLTSSDPAVLCVNADGTVTGMKAGKVTLTAKTYNKKTAKLIVSVKAAPAKLTLKGLKKPVIGLGDRYPLTPDTDASAEQLSYESSDPAVCTVDANGIVGAVGTGIAVITAKTYNGLSAECTITVSDSYGTIGLSEAGNVMPSVSPNYDFTKTFSVGERYTPDFTAALDYVGCSVEITDGKAYAKVENGAIVGVKAGRATALITCFNGQEIRLLVSVK